MEDIFEDLDKAADDDEEKKKKAVDLGPISRLVERQYALEAKPRSEFVVKLSHYIQDEGFSVAEVEEALKIRKKDLFKVRQNQIPDIMDEFGLTSIKTTSGITIEIQDGISVTPKDKERLHQYLRDNDAGDLIKDVISVWVTEEEPRKEVMRLLDEVDCEFERKESVHGMTLKKFVKDSMEEGKKLPEDIVGVYEYKFSKIKK